MQEGSQTVALTRSVLEKLLAEIESTAVSNGFSDSRASDIRTAVEEACRNALEHRGDVAGPSPTIQFNWGADTLTVVVTNTGPPFEIPATKPDLHRKMVGLEHSRGWGLFLIRSLADRVTLESQNGLSQLCMIFMNRSSSQGDDRG